MIIYESSVTYRKVGEVPMAKTIDGPGSIMDYMRGAFKAFPLQEQVWVLPMSRKNHIMCREMVGLGTATACLVSPSVIFRPVIMQGAPAMAVVHNHPSGDPQPSGADMEMAKKLEKCGKVLDINVLDFVVIGHNTYWSANDVGLVG